MSELTAVGEMKHAVQCSRLTPPKNTIFIGGLSKTDIEGVSAKGTSVECVQRFEQDT